MNVCVSGCFAISTLNTNVCSGRRWWWLPNGMNVKVTFSHRLYFFSRCTGACRVSGSERDGWVRGSFFFFFPQPIEGIASNHHWYVILTFKHGKFFVFGCTADIKSIPVSDQKWDRHDSFLRLSQSGPMLFADRHEGIDWAVYVCFLGLCAWYFLTPSPCSQ